MEKVMLERGQKISEKIVFIDGLSGTGKSMISALLGSFDGIERMRIEHIYEYLCGLDYLGQLSPDAGKMMMQAYADLAIYNSSISREVNFRPFDDSGLFNNPFFIRTLRRAFAQDGDIALANIKKTSPILQIVTHHILPAIGLAFRSFKENFYLIEMVRHPVYVAYAWNCFGFDRYGTDSRDFTIWLKYKEKALPWFAIGWESRYLESSAMDKVIYSIEWLSRTGDDAYNQLTDAEKARVMFVPFGRFVTQTHDYIEKIEALFGVNKTSETDNAMKRQKLPRKIIADGRGHSRYGWRKTKKNTNNSAELEWRKAYIKEHASKEAYDVLEKMSEEFEKRYLILDGGEI